MGIKHLMLLKKPDVFQLGSDNPNDPKVQKTLGQIGTTPPILRKCQRLCSWLLRNSRLQTRISHFKAIICFWETSTG